VKRTCTNHPICFQYLFITGMNFTLRFHWPFPLSTRKVTSAVVDTYRYLYWLRVHSSVHMEKTRPENIPNAGTRMWFAIVPNTKDDPFHSIQKVLKRQVSLSCLEKVLGYKCISHCAPGMKVFVTAFTQLIFGWAGLSPLSLLKAQPRSSA